MSLVSIEFSCLDQRERLPACGPNIFSLNLRSLLSLEKLARVLLQFPKGR